MLLKCGNRVLMVRGDKHNRWDRLPPLVQLVGQLDSRQFRHMNVEQKNVIGLLLQQFQGFNSIVRAIEDLNVVSCSQRILEGASGERFVVDNQYTHSLSLR